MKYMKTPQKIPLLFYWYLLKISVLPVCIILYGFGFKFFDHSDLAYEGRSHEGHTHESRTQEGRMHQGNTLDRTYCGSTNVNLAPYAISKRICHMP